MTQRDRDPVHRLMRPLSELPREAVAALRGVFNDIDDTLTTEGKLTAEAYTAMERLQRAGLLVVPITGRPAGWCDHIARMWPVDGVVGENGAFYFRHQAEQRKLQKRFLQSDAERAVNRRRMAALEQEILAAVPGAALSADQRYREVDLAIDVREDVEALQAAEIDQVVALFEAAGAHAKVSSIHVNGWFGDFDKLSMTRMMLDECFGIDLDRDKERFVFIGDSPNDAPMFAFFPNAVAVANVRDLEDRLSARPAYVTEARAGAGFAELAEAILAVHG